MWMKLSSYVSGTIASREPSQTGWSLSNMWSYGGFAGYEVLKFDLSSNFGGPNLIRVYTYPISYISTNINIVTGQWYYVTVTYNGNGLASGVNIYINGVAQSIYTEYNDLSSQSTTVSAPLVIGSGSNCILDDMRIYSRVLTQTEITNLYVWGGY